MVRFQCQDGLPSNLNRCYHDLINMVGIKLLAVAYARELGMAFSFPEITSLQNSCREYLMTSCGSWCQDGLYNLYNESFAWGDPLSAHVDEGMPTLSDFAAAVWAAEFEITPYKMEEHDYGEDKEELVDDFCEYASSIIHDHFIGKTSVPYPDDLLGEIVSDGMDGVCELIDCCEGTEEFMHRTAFDWLNLLNYVLTGYAEEDEDCDAYYGVLNTSHPKGEYIRKECSKRLSEPFYKRASEIIEACLIQLQSDTCATGENPDWYETRIVRDEEALSISVVYRQDSGFDITVINMAIYLLKQVIAAVEIRLLMEEKENEIR